MPVTEGPFGIKLKAAFLSTALFGITLYIERRHSVDHHRGEQADWQASHGLG